jgi:deoxyribose-phosphate aldolase
MQIEYACYDRALTEEEIKTNISCAAKLGIKNISTYQYSLPYIKPIVTEHNMLVTCPADYPYGLSDLKTRNFMVSQIVKSGVYGIDLVTPSKSITNRKYDKIRDDIKSNLEICQANNVELRYILEYRIFGHEILAKICQIFKSMGVDTVIPSTGQMIDDINDNIIAAKYLSAKSNINVVINGNVWNQKHIENIKNADIKNIRLHYLAGLDFFIKNNTA